MHQNDQSTSQEKSCEDLDALDLSRRTLLQAVGVSFAVLASPRELLAALAQPGPIVEPNKRFPHFQSTPVSYLRVKMQDPFWAPRQRIVRDVTVAWATRHWDGAGGLDAYRANPETYRALTQRGDMEAVKFIESMAAVVGLERDPFIEGLVDAWAKVLIEEQGADGYLQAGFAPTISHPPKPWQAFTGSHESYFIGHYLESALSYREATGRTELYDSAVRAIDNMAFALLGSHRPYISGHPEIEQALMRLYGFSGDPKYLQLAEWLIEQRGHPEGRKNGGKEWLDHLPVKEQRTIEGHAVCAAFLFNGVTEYVGATGDADYRQTVLSTWQDLVEHKMYLQGASGNTSSKFEGYLSKPYDLAPSDTYGESCAAFGNFQWAHSLFRLTGDAATIDVAERILYNAFASALSLSGDRYFYRNVSQIDDPVLRYDWHWVPCCPPNIVKLISKVGGYFYSTDQDGIFVKHYGASEVEVPLGAGVELTQQGNYPWSGAISIHVGLAKPAQFTLRLRIPSWADTYSLSVNGNAITGTVSKGWLAIRRRWQGGDRVQLDLPMSVKRVTLPPQFEQYRNLAALQRGPTVYCIEQQDVSVPVHFLSFMNDQEFRAEHRPGLLGGVTVLRGDLRQSTFMYDVRPTTVPVTFIPYGVWNNRNPGPMRIWLPTVPVQPAGVLFS